MTRIVPKRNHGKVVWDMKLEKSAHHIAVMTFLAPD